MKFKKSKALVAALAMLCLSTAATVTGTVAWFSANRVVTATGMKVKAKTDGSLVITKTSALPQSDTNTRTVDMGDTTAHELSVCQHDSEYTHGLKYVTNPGDVDEATGLAITGKTLTYDAAANTTGEGAVNYYVDYTIYIAASGKELTGQTLKVELDADASSDINDAASIDFYYATNASSVATESSTYLGALNLAGLDAVTNNGSATKTYWEISNLTIPQAGSGAAVAFLMRVYVDGGLKDTSTTTFCKNVDAEDIANTDLAVKFTASTPNA